MLVDLIKKNSVEKKLKKKKVITFLDSFRLRLDFVELVEFDWLLLSVLLVTSDPSELDEDSVGETFEKISLKIVILIF